MKSNTEKSTTELLNAFNNPKIIEDVKEARLTNPMQELGNEMLTFFKARIKQISKVEDFKDNLIEVLKNKLVEDKNVTFSQISNLFTSLCEQNSIASESFISLFRTAPNTTNPFTSNINKNNDSNLEKAIINMTPEDQNALHKLTRLLSMIDERDKIKQ